MPSFFKKKINKKAKYVAYVALTHLFKENLEESMKLINQAVEHISSEDLVYRFAGIIYSEAAKKRNSLSHANKALEYFTEAKELNDYPKNRRNWFLIKKMLNIMNREVMYIKKQKLLLYLNKNEFDLDKVLPYMKNYEPHEIDDIPKTIQCPLTMVR